MSSFKGCKLRTIRKQQGFTIRKLAEEAGVSVSQISQIERGQVIPTLELFWKLCQVLQMPLNYFFEDDHLDQENIVVRKNNRRQIHFPNSNVAYHLLSPYDNGYLQFLLIEIEPGEVHEPKQIAHAGEECGFVQSGQLTVWLGDQKYVLEEGDSIQFRSSIPHRFINESLEKSISIWAMTSGG